MLELGVKSELADGSLRVNAALYYYDYDDLQITRAGGESDTIVTENAASAEVTGIDVDVTWQVSEALTLVASGNLLNARYEDYIGSGKVFLEMPWGPGPGATDVTGLDYGGEDMLRAPNLSAFLEARYEIRLTSALVPVSISWSYKDNYDFDFIISPETALLRQDSYSLLNARVGFEPTTSRWSLAIWGRNLTDEEYFDDVVIAGPTGLRGSFGPPRTYGFDFTIRL